MLKAKRNTLRLRKADEVARNKRKKDKEQQSQALSLAVSLSLFLVFRISLGPGARLVGIDTYV